MKNILIIFLVIISVQTFGQYSKEFGINLWTSGYDLLKQEEQRWITLDIFYKKYDEDKKLMSRWSANLSRNLWIGDVYWDTTVQVSNVQFEYTGYTTIGTLGIKKGYEKVYEVGKIDFYIGGDFGIKTILGFNYEHTELSSPPIDAENKYTFDFLFSVIPFSGVRIPIGKRFFFTAEVGLELGVLFANRTYLQNETVWAKTSENSFYFPWKGRYDVNNIGFSYRF